MQSLTAEIPDLVHVSELWGAYLVSQNQNYVGEKPKNVSQAACTMSPVNNGIVLLNKKQMCCGIALQNKKKFVYFS